MKIKVGEYVRTDNGICKIIDNADKYVKDYQVSVDYIGGMYSQVINKDRILKCSKNIIDLIEVGDVIKYKELRDWFMYGTKANETYILNLKSQKEVDKFKKYVEDKEIEFISIVTKEAFASAEYSVETD